VKEDSACSIYLKKTNIKTLELIPIEKLKKHALDLS
jgi:signal transduction protein with GAF and PtsI domain